MDKAFLSEEASNCARVMGEVALRLWADAEGGPGGEVAESLGAGFEQLAGFLSSAGQWPPDSDLRDLRKDLLLARECWLEAQRLVLVGAAPNTEWGYAMARYQMAQRRPGSIAHALEKIKWHRGHIMEALKLDELRAYQLGGELMPGRPGAQARGQKTLAELAEKFGLDPYDLDSFLALLE